MARRLAYTSEFKQYVREHPNLKRKFIEAYKSKADAMDFDGGSIKRIWPQRGTALFRAWEVKAGGREFFVKESRNFLHEQDGFSQFLNLQKLKTIEMPGIVVVNCHFGFDNCGKTSLLVLDNILLPISDSIMDMKNKRAFFPD